MDDVMETSVHRRIRRTGETVVKTHPTAASMLVASYLWAIYVFVCFFKKNNLG